MTERHPTTTRPTLVRAEGIHVWDRDGRRYLDATSGAFCAQLGYSRPDLVRAMSEAAERLPHARPSIFESEESVEYSRALVEAAGAAGPGEAALPAAVRPRYTRVVLTSSGSEAVDVALKAAHLYQRAAGRPERRDIRYLSGHYHGATLGALGVTGWSARRDAYDALVGRSAAGRADIDPAEVDASCAAVILETIPAAGLGAPVPPPGYLARIRKRCDETGALWIADEVLTGFGRVGSMFAWQRLAERGTDRRAPPAGEVTPDGAAFPDLIVFGKGAGAGYAPLAGVIFTDRVAVSLEAAEFRHVQTYGGNPIACAVGRRVLGALREEGIFGRVRSLEGVFEDTLRRALEGLPGVRDIRGAGFLWGVELGGGPEATVVATRCRERGVLVHAARGDVEAIVIAPPLITEPEQFGEIASALRDSIAGRAAR